MLWSFICCVLNRYSQSGTSITELTGHFKYLHTPLRDVCAFIKISAKILPISPEYRQFPTFDMSDIYI